MQTYFIIQINSFVSYLYKCVYIILGRVSDITCKVKTPIIVEKSIFNSIVF